MLQVGEKELEGMEAVVEDAIGGAGQATDAPSQGVGRELIQVLSLSILSFLVNHHLLKF